MGGRPAVAEAGRPGHWGGRVAERPMRRDPGDPWDDEPAVSPAPAGPGPVSETEAGEGAGGDDGWEAGVDRFLAQLFPGTG
jgi:hypothetical protein